MKKRAFAVFAVVLIAIVLDLRRPPSAQWSTAAAVGSIHLYQATLSPIYAKLGVQCRFTPTCSHYGEEAVRKYGVVHGGYLPRNESFGVGRGRRRALSSRVP
jgi:hypothetical protein